MVLRSESVGEQDVADPRRAFCVPRRPPGGGPFFCAPAPPGSRGFDFGGNAVPSMSLVLGSFCAKAAGLAGIRARGSWWYNASVNATGALALAGA